MKFAKYAVLLSLFFLAPSKLGDPGRIPHTVHAESTKNTQTDYSKPYHITVNEIPVLVYEFSPNKVKLEVALEEYGKGKFKAKPFKHWQQKLTKKFGESLDFICTGTYYGREYKPVGMIVNKNNVFTFGTYKGGANFVYHDSRAYITENSDSTRRLLAVDDTVLGGLAWLVKDSKAELDETLNRKISPYTKRPRIAIGIKPNNNVVLALQTSAITALAGSMKVLDCEHAAALDGGGSRAAEFYTDKGNIKRQASKRLLSNILGGIKVASPTS